MAFKYKQGYFTPTHPEKYLGDVTKIVYRSSWELEVNKFFDMNPRVLRWGSEEIAIDYIKPTTGRVHKYYPDYLISYINKDGEVKWELIEVKPKQQTTQSRSRNQRTRLYENIQYAVNTAKWEAAIRWCEKMTQQTGYPYTFRILTEHKIFK